jgi:hypothetical protein
MRHWSIEVLQETSHKNSTTIERAIEAIEVEQGTTHWNSTTIEHAIEAIGVLQGTRHKSTTTFELLQGSSHWSTASIKGTNHWSTKRNLQRYLDSSFVWAFRIEELLVTSSTSLLGAELFKKWGESVKKGYQILRLWIGN